MNAVLTLKTLLKTSDLGQVGLIFYMCSFVRQIANKTAPSILIKKKKVLCFFLEKSFASVSLLEWSHTLFDKGVKAVG